MLRESSKKVVAYELNEARKIRVLVVDDDPVVHRVHRMLLEKHGLEIQAAYNGQEAVDLVRSGKIFNLMLMDMEIPIMGGTQATRILREMGVSCMIVGVTASCMETEKTTFMEAGLDLFGRNLINTHLDSIKGFKRYSNKLKI
ncbi:hypothetical protein ACS0TY_019154 [Phlomoides rotata]